MRQLTEILLGDGTRIPVLYDDRSVLAIDKPSGWILAPDDWVATSRNLTLALESSIRDRDSWARSRGIKFLRFIHRLDAETSGVLLLVKSAGAIRAYTELFSSRSVTKRYLAVVAGIPKSESWTCDLSIASDPRMVGRMRICRGAQPGLQAETLFRTLCVRGNVSLIEAKPITGRTHQIRIHLAEAGHPVVGDRLYGAPAPTQTRKEMPLGLRAVSLTYRDPFQHRNIKIEAPVQDFLLRHGFRPSDGAIVTSGRDLI